MFTFDAIAHRQGREHHGTILREAALLANAGQLTIRVGQQSFALAEVNEAFRQAAEGRGKGKTVIQLANE